MCWPENSPSLDVKHFLSYLTPTEDPVFWLVVGVLFGVGFVFLELQVTSD